MLNFVYSRKNEIEFAILANILLYWIIHNKIKGKIRNKDKLYSKEENVVEDFYLGYHVWHAMQERKNRKRKNEQSFFLSRKLFGCDELFEWFNFIVLSRIISSLYVWPSL